MSHEISFSDFKLNKQLLNAIDECGFDSPTPIQIQAINPILSGQDVIGVAQTGTGKTAAYLIPLIKKLNYAQGTHPRAVIMVPTRELAVQVGEHFAALAKYTDLRCAVVYGGIGKKIQAEILLQGSDIIIATPGRFMDHYFDMNLQVKKIKTIILDEAERLMDMGFLPQLHRLQEIIPQKKQVVLFSATMSDLVRRIANDFLKSPVELNIRPEIKTASGVTQCVYFVPNLISKIHLLQHLTKDESLSKVIVFCKTKVTASNVGKFLERKYGEDSVKVIHGNKAQQTRLNAVRKFEAGECRFLVSTDVAARGMDVDDVSHVINFDVPIIYEDYIHRIGRTGRVFKSGISITFCSPNDEYPLNKIQKLIGQKITPVDVPVEVEITETPKAEAKKMAMEIDIQKRKEDPDFKGAFHVKKFAHLKRKSSDKSKSAERSGSSRQSKDKAKKKVVVKGPTGKKKKKKTVKKKR